MPNEFDLLKMQVFDTTTKAMGYSAEWTPLAGGTKQTCRVHFKSPNAMVKNFGNVMFEARMYKMEYKRGDFVGLYELIVNAPSVANGGNLEVVVIEGVSYYCDSINAMFDGDYYEVSLIPIV